MNVRKQELAVCEQMIERHAIGREQGDADAAAKAGDPDFICVERIIKDAHGLHEFVAGDLSERPRRRDGRQGS